MFRIAKTYSMSCAHHLPNHDGKCRQPHGHNYKIEVVVRGDLNEQSRASNEGMVMDYEDLDTLVVPIIRYLDHNDLNEVVGFRPTAELLASYIAMQLSGSIAIRGSRLDRVRVSETDKTWAEINYD